MSTNEKIDDIKVISCCAPSDKDDDDKINECTNDCKMKECTNDCSGNCQQNHTEEYEKMSEEEFIKVHDEIIFKQPKSCHNGDCPICCLPMPLDRSQYGMQVCCNKIICNGCAFANGMSEEKGGRRIIRCPFCRKRVPSSEDEANEMSEKNKDNVSTEDPVALHFVGMTYYDEDDYENAFKYFSMGAALCDATSHYFLSNMYGSGEGVEEDGIMDVYHLEMAAVKGHPDARFDLGYRECLRERYDRAVKHFIIGSNLGCDQSIQQLKQMYRDGHVAKDDFAATLRAHKAAVDAMKSPQREEAEAFHRWRRENDVP